MSIEPQSTKMKDIKRRNLPIHVMPIVNDDIFQWWCILSDRFDFNCGRDGIVISNQPYRETSQKEPLGNLWIGCKATDAHVIHWVGVHSNGMTMEYFHIIQH